MKHAEGKVHFGHLVGVLVGFTFFAPAALAVEAGWYVGHSAGQSKVDIDNAQFDSLAVGSSTTSDEKDIGLKVFGGYQFTKNLAIEAAYIDFGKFTARQTVSTGTVDVKFEPKGWNIAGVGTLPISENFSLLGKLGAFSWSLDYKCTAVSGTLSCLAPSNRSAYGTDLSFGVGLSYAITKQWNLRMEYERFKDVGDQNATRGIDNGKTGQSDIDLLSIGVEYKFF